MSDAILSSYLQIRYIKLHFTLTYVVDCAVPANKVSALRGGIGEMLLRKYCIRDRRCENCGFLSECPVQRFLYSKPEIEPAFMGQGDSVGYVIECEDQREQMQAGDETKLNIILFGKSIIYFSHIFEALYELGMQGYGRYNACFEISSVTNSVGEDLLDDNGIIKEQYCVMMIADYVDYRKRQLQKEGYDGTCTLHFSSPLSVKFKGEFIRDFQTEALISAAARRIYILNCYEGNEADPHDIELDMHAVKEAQNSRAVRVERYSSRKNEKMTLHGIVGSVRLAEVSDRALEALLVCELVHLGKNTSFGFGRYRISIK